MTQSRKHYGKYRGVVRNNVDLESRGRIQCEVPDVLGYVPTTWAMPCVPVAGLGCGFYSVPMLGSGVWVEFEKGDVDKPIWVGGWWGTVAEVPKLGLAQMLPVSPNIAMTTPGQATIVISDVPAIGIQMMNGRGAMFMMNDAGILLTNGKGSTLAMVGKAFTVNEGALLVT